MASGVPLVSTKVGMAPEIIQSGENGYVVDIGDRVQLFEAAKKILDSSAIQNQFHSVGLMTIQKYNWNSISSEYFKHFYQ